MAEPSEKTPEERLSALEARTEALSDAMIVHGYLEARIERNLTELTDDVRDLSRITRALADGQAHLQTAVQALADNQSHIQSAMQTIQAAVQALADNQSTLQAALQDLIKQIDRFLRGQQRDGHGTS
jgi:ABC-type transporter Mla subunit MlaD